MAIYGIASSTNVDRPHHPSASWANWKNGKFIAWDRDEQIEKEITLPKEFVVVAEGRNIKGFLQDKGGVWSPEVFSFADDVFTVKDNSGGTLVEGLRKDIKEKVKSWGLKLNKTIHYFDPKKPDELRTFCIKGAALKEWMNTFSEDNRFAAANNRISLDKVTEGKTGTVTYTFPVFKIGGTLTDKEREAQRILAIDISNYHNANKITKEELEETKAVEDELLPF